MGWEMRGANGPYYYRSVRRGWRVLREYHGKGSMLMAEKAILSAKMQRKDRLAERQAVLDETVRTQPAMALTDEIDVTTQLIFEASMLVAGFHRPNYGRWRKRRDVGYSNTTVPIDDKGRDTTRIARSY